MKKLICFLLKVSSEMKWLKGSTLKNYQKFVLKKKHQFFHQKGCKLSHTKILSGLVSFLVNLKWFWSPA